MKIHLTSLCLLTYMTAYCNIDKHIKLLGETYYNNNESIYYDIHTEKIDTVYLYEKMIIEAIIHDKHDIIYIIETKNSHIRMNSRYAKHVLLSEAEYDILQKKIIEKENTEKYNRRRYKYLVEKYGSSYGDSLYHNKICVGMSDSMINELGEPHLYVDSIYRLGNQNFIVESLLKDSIDNKNIAYKLKNNRYLDFINSYNIKFYRFIGDMKYILLIFDDRKILIYKIYVKYNI